MYRPDPDTMAPEPLRSVEAAIGRAAGALGAAQRDDGHWCYELEADCTIPAEYILLRHYLGEADDRALEAGIGRYLRRIQADHGGWSLYHDGQFDLSATVKAYYALKMIGDDVDAPHMARARAAVLAAGGAGNANVFTRIQLALYEAGPWSTVPTMPPEIILLPRSFPIHLSRMSYWARTVIVPLLVLQTLRPRAVNRRGVKVDELYAPGPLRLSRASEGKWLWVNGFKALDAGLKTFERFWPKRMRARALKRCEAFVIERLNGEDGLGAIYPAMANSVMMFAALGYPEDHPLRTLARTSVEKLLVDRGADDEGGGEIYCQPCVSPVWDTALAAQAMQEVREGAADAGVARSLDWLKPLQVLDIRGDWADARPDVRPGGWAFQYRNDHYPDLDDTAVVVMAMEQAQRRGLASGLDEAIARGREWVLGLQSRDGGWGAFDADNAYHYLNDIPFADHGALLDPPTADVTARCVSMLAQLGLPEDRAVIARGLAWLERDQHAEGSWWGRWGVNHVYGTWSVLCALNAAGLGPETPMVAKAVAWLRSIQNEDGGWGESCDSYALDRQCHEHAPSNPSQTGWALLALMAAGEVDTPAVARGIAWLQDRQEADGLWGQEQYVGGGFPRVFYLRYHGYPKYFPLWALARYRNLKRGNLRRTTEGM